MRLATPSMRGTVTSIARRCVRDRSALCGSLTPCVVSQCYQNETIVGKAFKKAFDSGVVKRSDLFITSKLWNSEHAADDVAPALQQSIDELQCEYLDLYLIHW